MKINTFSVVKKLDDRDSLKVNKLIAALVEASQVFGWKLVDSHEDSELIIAIGGDGTVMEALRISQSFKGIPVVGINIGKLGFLAEIAPNELEVSLIALLKNKAWRDARTFIQEDNLGFMAVNEFVMAPKNTRDTLKYEFFINGVNSGSHHANNLLVSTPTGSTAYALSARGAIIQPNTPVFQIVPVAAMSLTSCALIVPDSALIEVVIQTYPGVEYELISDGRVKHTVVGSEDQQSYSFKFKKAESSGVLLHQEGWNFFTVLRDKLHWNAVL